MKPLVMGTTNQAKVEQIAGALRPIGVVVTGVKDKKCLPNVIEDGKTVQENARKKAIAYAKFLNQRVFSMDNALYLKGLLPADQPGIHVRRIDGQERSSDEELLEHYQKIIENLGGRVDGHWEFGVCVADPDGSFWETTIHSPRIFVSKRSVSVVPGYPLESLQVDSQNGSYLSEITKEERDLFWQRTIGEELSAFIRTIE